MTERLTVVAGCMFSGKTEEVLREWRRSHFAEIKAQAFKPIIDNRFEEGKVVSHDGKECDAVPIGNSAEILDRIEEDTRLVTIDEVQFLDEGIVDVVKELLLRNVRVIVAGLPQDFRGEPFGSMPQLLAFADQITLLTAICTHVKEDGTICGRDATRTQRIINGQPANYNDPIVLIGAEESYAPRCPDHHIVPGKPKR